MCGLTKENFTLVAKTKKEKVRNKRKKEKRKDIDSFLTVLFRLGKIKTNENRNKS
jgi:hypothetical protein